jgi:FixJ family two-component response regulator
LTEELKPLVRIVDDETTICRSEAFIFKLIGLESVCYSSAEEFLENLDVTRPGCVVADLQMSGMNGLEMMTEMKKRGILLPIVFLTGHGSVDSAVFALKEGATDYLQKPVKPEVLQKIVQNLIDSDVQRRQTEEAVKAKRERYDSLTEREKEVVLCVAKDLMNKQIAVNLGIAEHTVKIHRLTALRKLGIRTALETHKFLGEIGEAVD